MKHSILTWSGAALLLGLLTNLAYADDQPHLRTDAFVTVSPFAAFEEDLGDTASEKGIWELGAGGAVVYRVARWLDLGVGLRYDYGPGNNYTGHFVSVPVLATFVIPVSATDHEVHVGLGLGFALSEIIWNYQGVGSSALGFSAEAAVGYLVSVRSDMHVVLQAGVRLDSLDGTGTNRNGSPPWVLNGQLPFLRLGLGWRGM